MSAEETPRPEKLEDAGRTTTTIDELFGNDGAEEVDLFAHLASGGEGAGLDASTEHEKDGGDVIDLIGQDPSEPNVQPEQTTAQDEQLFAEATQSARPVAASAPDDVELQPTEHSIALAPVATSPTTAQDTESAQDKDFSDLLAEFEAESGIPPEEPMGALDESGSNGETLVLRDEIPPSSEEQEHIGSEHRATDVQSTSSDTGDHGKPAGEDTGTLQVPIAASALFTEDPTDSATFEELIPTSQPDHPASSSPPRRSSPSPVPDFSTEHSKSDARPTGLGIDAAGDTSFKSLFTDTSNWLGDTTFDDSIQIGATLESGHEAEDMSLPVDTASAKAPQDDGSQPLQFDVPQGWYDDNGEWHWYTEEEQEQVRLTMMGQGGWEAESSETPDKSSLGQDQTPSLPYSPALQAGFSENSARRTPQPDTPSKLPSNPYDSYAPSTAQRSATTSSSSPYAPYSSSSMNDSYAPSSSYSSYTPTTAARPSSDPYAPGSNQQSNVYMPQSATNPYAPSAQNTVDPYAPAPMPTAYTCTPYGGQPQVKNPEPPKPRPQPQRVASNAYDPPFLKPQKSFVRAPAAVPSPGYPAFGGPASLAMSPPLASATPPPPPAGPPKRATNEARPSSRGPQFAAPPPKILPRAQTTAIMQHGHDTGYDAPPRPPSVSQDRQVVDLAQSFSPPQPLHRPPPSAFDPPLRAKSYAAPPRPPSVPVHQAYGSPLQHVAPPPFAPPPKASQSPYAPPRPLSRGPPSRRASPMFEARPPSRPDVNQRMRSPSQSHHFFGVEQLLSPPAASLHFPEHQHRALHDEVKLSQIGETHNMEGELDGRELTHGESPRLPVVSDQPHISPPVLSRKYDEEGEEGDFGEAEDPYAPSASDDQSSSQQQYETGNDRGYQAYHSHEHTAEASLHPSELQQLPPPPRTSTASPAGRQPSYDPYAPQPSSLGLKTHASPEKAVSASASGYASYSPYAPSTQGVVDLSEDPYAPPTSRNDQISYNQYAPSITGLSPTKTHFQPTHPSRVSTDTYEPSPYSPQASARPIGISQPLNPYAPGPARTASPAYSTGYGLSPPTNNYFQSMHADASSDPTYVPQQVLEQKPVSEDPLGRCTLAARNAPIAVFGFGGVLVTAFPGSAEAGDFHKGHSRIPSYGYASGRGQLWIRSVSEVAAPTALKSDQSSFPGPLVFDPSTAKGAAGDKKKREAVLAYLDSRAEEIEKGLPYLKSSANKARREEEGRLVLIRALKALVVGDGKLTGSPEVEDALREALGNPSSPVLSTSPVAATAMSGFSSSLYPPAHSSSIAAPVAASPSQLKHISYLLAQGNKRDAALWAAEKGLWSHALVISSSVDVELWREIVGGFTTSEIGGKPEGTAGIKASYLLFSGINAATVEELVNAATITEDPSSDQWRQVVGTVLFNAKPTELACLDELGSRFLNMGLVNAAHVCFLLSPLSPFFDLSPASYDRQIMLAHNHRDEEAVVFAEIAEYARGLISAPKGQEPAFAGLPQLLPFKLARAWRLAELGEVELAQKYCASIEAGSKIGKNMPSLLPPAFAASLEDLLERLTGSPSVNPAKGLGSNRKGGNKPGFDKLGSWIEGRLTKFIAGEEGDSAAPSKPSATAGKAAGPFTHFSTISPNPNDTLSRQGSVADFGGPGQSSAAPNGYLGVGSVSRTTSPALHMTPSTQWDQPPAPGYGHTSSSSSSSAYGEQHAQHPGVNSYSPWLDNDSAEDTANGGETPHAFGQDHHASAGAGDEGDFISPMAQLSIGPSVGSSTSYDPPKASSRPAFEDDEDDDLGFSNKSLSRGRTPKPASGEGVGAADTSNAGSSKPSIGKDAKSEPAQAEPAPPAKSEAKSSWLGRIWGGKKEAAETHGPTKANLGEASSMVFDPELKRWVVKGAKPEASAPSATPPPPRAQTASPSQAARPDMPATTSAPGHPRAMSAAPPPMSMSSINGGNGAGFPRPGGPPSAAAGFAEGPNGGIKRVKSSLVDSVSASDIASSGTPPSGAGGRLPPPPGSNSGGPPSRPSTAGPTGASLDDLLSRPPSKRPGSAAAKKGARNRYVDVFQPGT